MKKILSIVFIGLVLLIGVLFFKTFTFRSEQTSIEPLPEIEVSDSVIGHLQQVLRFQTVSYDDSAQINYQPFIELHQYLEKTFPLFHRVLEKETILQYSLLFHWKGKNPSLEPVIMMAHQDVVPVEDVTRDQWKADPFGGELKDGIIWGRGAIDDKNNLAGMIESAEMLLKQGFKPQRDIYFVFGHDEERGGLNGAKQIAEMLKDRNVKPAFVLDEGGLITLEKIPGMENKSIAMFGTSEKGYMTLELTVNKPGGHSSMPEKETAIDILAQAIIRLRANPFKADFSTSSIQFVNHIGPEMPFVQKLAMANLWLFKPYVLKKYAESNTGNAMVRTTIAPTIIHSGMKENVVPTQARAIVNFRILPGNAPDFVMEHVKRSIDDTMVKIKVIGNINEPTAAASDTGWAYRTISNMVKNEFPGTITSPFLLIGATDSRYFSILTPNVYKFSPVTDPIGFHGLNEQISVEAYKSAIRYYYQLMKSL